MSRFSSFDGLPLIVHDRILHSLPSPKDVANAIRASPGFLHAFMTGRRSILLSAMRNFLSLENQHLMNLVMAAPHYYKHGEAESQSTTSTSLEYNDIADFDRDLYKFSHQCNLRPLTPKTFHCSIKLYAIMNKAVEGYGIFTFLRAQHRMPMLSTPEACKLRYKHMRRDLRTPDDEEISKVWRGFLLYELLCSMHGVPRTTAAAMDETYEEPKELLGANEFFERMRRSMQEEVMCVQQYVREQYDLAYNALVDGLEMAVRELGRRASEMSLSFAAHDTIPIMDLEDGIVYHSVEHLVFEISSSHNDPWSIKLAALGVRFLQEFLSWNASTRLDFARITYRFLTSSIEFYVRDLFQSDIDLGILFNDEFGWPIVDIEHCRVYEELEFPSEARLRAVGWVFWKNTERLYFMNLEEDTLNECYGSKGFIRETLRLQGRPHLMETSVQPQDWERIRKYFVPSFSDDQHNHIKGLFTSASSLKSSDIADVVSILRCQDMGDAPIEAKDSDV